jgi:hypothetical protein
MIKSRRALRLFLCFVLFGPVPAQAQTDKNGNPFNSARFHIESPCEPAFRITYTKTGDDKMSVKVELAPPGKPDSFATYAEGEARREGNV